MRIAKTESYNNSPSFGMKVLIIGRKETVPKDVILKIESMAKRTGRHCNSIALYFGKPNLDVLHYHDGRIISQSRSIFARTIVQNVTQEKDLSYCIFSDKLSDSRMILDAFNEYINLLHKGLKPYNKHKKRIR